MNVLVLHGPNLNLLGEREPEVYGSMTLAELDDRLRARAAELGMELRIFQSNHEGALIDRLHAERGWMEGLVINPGALGHTSYALRDAIAAVRTRAYEVHLSDVEKREPFRKVSVLADVCEGRIHGKREGSYLEALEKLAQGAERPRERSARPAPRKTLGRADRPHLGRATPSRPPSGAPAKKPKAPRRPLGRPAAREEAGVVKRSEVAARVAECLRGKLSPRALSDWAKGLWLAVERGQARYESGAEDILGSALIRLTTLRGPDDHALIELLARLS